MARLFTNGMLVRSAQRAALWLGLYAFGFFKLDLRWLLFFLAASYIVYVWSKCRMRRVSSSSSPAPPGLSSERHLPAWVLSPDAQRAEWVNAIFRQLWPHVEEFLQRAFQDFHADEELANGRIRFIRFPLVSLGNIAPKVDGIKVHSGSEVHRDEMIIDVNLEYAGNLKLDVEIGLGGMLAPSASANISNVSLTGALRLHLRPLLNDVPFIGGVTLSFLRPPELDFDLGGVAAALELPGLDIVLRRVISEHLQKTMVLPNSVSASLVKLAEGEDLSDLIDSRSTVTPPAGVLTVQLVEAKGLVNKDVILLGQGKSDPYARVEIVADGETHSFKTAVVPNNLHPAWKMVVDVAVEDASTIEDPQIEVWDDDHVGKDDFLGSCSIPVQVIRTAMTSGQTQDVWKILEGVKRGSFHVQVGWCDLKTAASVATSPSSIISKSEGTTIVVGPSSTYALHRGVLSVRIDSCCNLLAVGGGSGGHSGGTRREQLRNLRSFVKAELCGASQATEIAIGGENPIFEHKMNFLVKAPASDTLKLTVVDEKTGESMGTMRFNVSDLLERPSLSIKNNIFTLMTRNARTERSPQITFSAAFRYIHRPKTSSFGVHQSLHDLHKIMTTPISASHSHSPQSMKGRNIENGADDLLKQPNGEEPIRHADHPKKTFQGKRIVTNGGLIYPKQCKVSSRKSFGESLDLKHIDDTSSCASSTIITNKNNVGKRDAEISDRFAVLSDDANSLHTKRGAATIDARSSSTPAFPEFTEKLNEASEFVKKNPVRRLNNPELSGNLAGRSTMPPPPTTVHKPRIQLGLKYSTEHKLLSIVVHKARNLHETPHTTLPNPYVKIYTIERGVGLFYKRLDNKRKTKTLKNSVHPVFEETLDYFVPSVSDLKLRRLEISVCSDGGVLGRNVVLAHCIVSLRPLHDAIMGNAAAAADKKYLGESCTADVTEWYTLTPPKPTPPAPDSVSMSTTGAGTTPKLKRRSKSFANAHLPTGTGTAKEVQYDSKRSL